VLDAVAALALGGDARAEDLVRLVFEDYAAAVAAVGPHTSATAVRLPDRDWTPYPA
jgi:3-hydroxyisobutyrate dehydrogenase-like beta-hydroxyacid dehydrogenase